MSRTNLLAALEATGDITRYTPDGNRTCLRCLFLTRAAVNQYNDDRSAVNLLGCRAYIKAALDRWVLGHRIYGDKKKGRSLRPLHPPPDHIWELRVTEPVVQARLFGLFFTPNTLILTHFHSRRFLDENGGANWEVSMRQSEGAWKNIFPTERPFVGHFISDYVTENCDDFPVTTKSPSKRRTR